MIPLTPISKKNILPSDSFDKLEEKGALALSDGNTKQITKEKFEINAVKKTKEKDDGKNFETTITGLEKAAQPILKSSPSREEKFCSLVNKGAKRLAGIGNLLFAYHLFDRGLANFLGLQTLRHGTNISSYLGISLRGANPQMGGSMEPHVISNCPVNIQVTKDFYAIPDPTFLELSRSQPKLFGYLQIPMLHTLMASYNLCGLKIHHPSLICETPNTSQKAKKIFAELLNLFTPIIRFRFKPEELQVDPYGPSRFMYDPALLSTGALKTPHAISPLRLGICGSLLQGVGHGMFHRMEQNPFKVITGIASMTFGSLYLQKFYWDEKGKPEKAVLNNPLFNWPMTAMKRVISYITPSRLNKPAVRSAANLYSSWNRTASLLHLAKYL